MKKLIYIVLFFPIFVMGQSSGQTTSQKESTSATHEKVQIDKTAGFIWNNFSKSAIKAYENRAIDKLNEFYSYLILLQDASSSDLQNELKQNIKQLLVDENLSFQNIIDFQNKKYTIDEILMQVVDKKLKFTMPIINQNPYMNHNDFEFTLTLKVELNNVSKQLNLTQKVFLFAAIKKFGDTQKEVWELKVGGF